MNENVSGASAFKAWATAGLPSGGVANEMDLHTYEK